ncbi:Epoxide hydrolase 4 [Colletotrichum orbiculare MAFF 240422]|uniref:Epoxide hydrolase 4 n=1 Tax=Colletotrichum orbiculare (strain 104-T / ATCC 96160 / CBS 514.97 / LARS 414 / MAFF 240422) TaxID=1213857 RepID=A0A484FAK5_COLOR|nr:Epoxide hydrolase 4 [Colletotrichum orbiculare MAFF 240422]
MAFSHKIAALGGDLRIAYIDQPPKSDPRGVILLIHGFPQTLYQYRHVIEPFAASGYRVDLAELLDHLGITEPIHVVGHDIGGMNAYAFATRHEHRTASVVWGECPLPGTTAHEEDRTVNCVQQFHFLFHSVPDLPEALLTGREEMYLSHLFDKLTHNRSAISEQDLREYVSMYRRPGALRCAFEVYRAFLADAEGNRAWVAERRKCRIPTLGLSGGESRHKMAAPKTLSEVHVENAYRVAEVPGSGHYVAEENPEGFVKAISDLIAAAS